jgi:hypothetical protein
MIKWLRKIRIGFLHAKFHRYMNRAIAARSKRDVVAFKKYIYRAEDAWKRIVILTEKSK